MIEAHIFRQTEEDLEFLLMKRAENEIYAGVWQMVTGAIMHGEKAFDAAFREINEETGIIPEKMWVVPFVNSFYSRRRDHICMVPVFAALVEEKSEVKLSDEHSEYQWVRKDDAIRLLAWQGQRNSVKTIHNYFTNEISFLNFEEISIQKCLAKLHSNKK